MAERIPVLYLAPWIIYGGSDKNTIDWFRWIDRGRFAPYLVTTQPSPNPMIGEVADHAEEIWVLPDLMAAEWMPEFIFDFIESRRIEVIHLMNSRIGFDLLPDLSNLAAPPGVVVQLHVEEEDRSGYVRYVTTRYGNLVDRFSTSNQHVADAVHGYGVPRDKISVIYTGVDAEEEFGPGAHPAGRTPAAGDGEVLRILFAARLTDQKDPLLALEVATGLRDRGVAFRLHMVGEGDLEGEVARRIAELGLGDLVQTHPPVPGLQDWYADCDVLLLTSKFEGIPCVLFEAMAMGMPIVAPALPPIKELLHREDDGLVDRARGAAGYVEALAGLAERGRLDQVGAEMRERAKQRFSVREMAALHEDTYAELAAGRERHEREVAVLPEPVRFPDRPLGGRPLVSVLIPHFNQARFLVECVDSVEAQDYPEVEIVVVDDASTEEGTAAALDLLEARERVRVVRLAENGGPSRARNEGLALCSGAYVLPVDSDNLLLPQAVGKLVAQLEAAPEDVGFVYPNVQYFGNREDYYEAPPYNLYDLLHGNYCDTCSLLDRRIFDAGIRYREEIRLGHEDWEFVLRLAAHQIKGEPAEGRSVLYRKWGFNRSDMVDHAADDFREAFLAENSPFLGREAEIKAVESPALSVVALRPADPAPDLGLQSCIDLELIDAAGDPSAGLLAARGPYVALTEGSGAELLSDPAFCERVLRRFELGDDELDAIVLADAGAEGRFAFRSLTPGDSPDDPVPHTVIWRRTLERELPSGLYADPGAPASSLARMLSGAGMQMEWRHAPGPGLKSQGEATTPDAWRELPADPAVADDPFGTRAAAKPLIPGEGEYRVRRWEDTPTWIPPLSTVLVRQRARIGECRLITNGWIPPSFELDHFVGALRATGVQGTKLIIRVGDTFKALARDEWAERPPGALELGYAEEAPLPGLDGLALAVHRETGEHVLVTLPDDPIIGSVDVIDHLGFMDPFPMRPRTAPESARPLGLRPLLKSLDHEARRHRYSIDEPAGELLAELGGAAESGRQGAIPFWLVDGHLLTADHQPSGPAAGGSAAARWVAEPIAWGGIASGGARAKALARRAATAVRPRPEPGVVPERDPDGWLFDSSRPGMVPLFAAYHPVTGDQLLTRAAADIGNLGYVGETLLGFLRQVAPVTGEGADRQLSIPWARRFGAVPRRG